MEDVLSGEWKLKVNLSLVNTEGSFTRESRKEISGPVSSALVVKDKSFENVVAPESSKKLGGETEDMVVVVSPSEEVVEVLRKWHVLFLHYPRDPKPVQTSVFMEGWSKVLVTDMGDCMVLLQGKEVGDIEDARSLKKEWWDANFKMVKPCYPNTVSRKRKVWVKLWGVPLHVLDDKFFKHIGKMFGDFIDFDADMAGRRWLDVARIFVSTSKLGFIENRVRINVMGASCIISVIEDAEVPVREEVADGVESGADLEEIIGDEERRNMVVEAFSGNNSDSDGEELELKVGTTQSGDMGDGNRGKFGGGWHRSFGCVEKWVSLGGC
jgi:hypothetical protein